MKLVLINAINTRNTSETVFPNLGLGYIASFLHKYVKDVEINIIDSDGQNILELLKIFSPDLVGISAVSQNFDFVIHISEECSQVKVPVFVGGIHISCLPKSLPEGAEVGVIGEGERTTVDLIRCFLQDGCFKKESLQRIEGLIFRNDDDKIVFTPQRKLIDDLDEVPFPDRSLLNIQKNGFLHIFSSRGCNYRCTFCSNSRFWRKARSFSYNYVFDELKEVIEKYHPRAITFYDDDFLINKHRIENLVRLIEKTQMNKKVEFNLMTRSDVIDEEIVSLLKRMNVTVVSLGLESGSERTLDFLKCGTLTVQRNMLAIELLNKAGIFTYGFFIIGAPDETEEDIFATFDFIKKSSLTGFSVYTLVPYPGTPIWDYAKSRNLVSDSMHWSKLALNINEAREDVVVLCEKISSKRLYQLYWQFQKLGKRKHIIFMLKRAYRNPGLLLPRLERSILHVGKKICQNQ